MSCSKLCRLEKYKYCISAFHWCLLSFYFNLQLTSSLNLVNSHVLLFVIKIVSLISVTSGDEDTCFKPGECTDGFHIDADFVTDKYNCLENCQSKSSCTFFTFYPDLNYCELFSNCSTIETETWYSFSFYTQLS